MKMYKIDDIMELLQHGIDSGNGYAGFDTNEAGNLVITLKEHEPDWRDNDGWGEAVEELELLEAAGEY